MYEPGTPHFVSQARINTKSQSSAVIVVNRSAHTNKCKHKNKH